MLEPTQSFPYRPPDDALRREFAHIFSLEKPLPDRLAKSCFDRTVAAFFLLAASPLLLLLKLAYITEGWLSPSARGPMLFYYNAVSAGKTFRKYKLRIIKQQYVDPKLAAEGDWHAFASEWSPETRTVVGHFVKNFYLDEIPQFFSVLSGEMSIVGPRPLAVHHYQRDLEQGNVPRKFLKGGLLGLGHINKGTSKMGDPRFEYEYLDSYLKRSSLSLLVLDLWIIMRGVQLMAKGKGL